MVAKYLSSLPARNLIAFSQDDATSPIPRYLLQASQSFYTSEPANSDAMYKAFQPIVASAAAFPNAGLPEAKDALKVAVLAKLQPAPIGLKKK
jgi:hypothetical protein